MTHLSRFDIERAHCERCLALVHGQRSCAQIPAVVVRPAKSDVCSRCVQWKDMLRTPSRESCIRAALFLSKGGSSCYDVEPPVRSSAERRVEPATFENVTWQYKRVPHSPDEAGAVGKRNRGLLPRDPRVDARRKAARARRCGQ